ncbi:conserved exported hypothetical protein [Flavobacterium sp. 9AF]|uniref:hypothetical protein n=1 Tax=Flavobacterium sp. 9AF TaxID=2653142 RepID=UPI0012F02F14|nr:hypothetical protein [Flavobacterium sp. 9AF]VXC29847.1 conserved exported hypothetical protein [Flavobacterium sp. 9AF]
MKLFKIITLLSLFSVGFTFSQQFNFQTTTLTILQKDTKGKWGKWSTPEKVKIIVKLDYDKNKIIIYSNVIQYYSIAEYLPKEVTKVDEINSYLCKDIDGYPFKISFIVRKDLKNKTQMYVYSEDYIFCYDIFEIVK